MRYQYAHPELFDGVARPDFHAHALSGNLVIYGAGFQGLLAAYLLDRQGIGVLCFADQDPKKQGTPYYGLPVLAPEEVRKSYPDAVPIVTPYGLLPAWRYVTEELGYRNAVTPYSLFLDFDSDGFDTLPELPDWYHPSALALHVDQFLRKCVNLQTEHSLPSFDISVTRKCNLRCKNCNALMPCYENPESGDPEEILRDIGRILEGRTVHHISIEGGEAFLWKPLPYLLRALSGRRELMGVYIFTNGTVIPDAAQLEALKRPDVTVFISDYGSISQKDTLIELFEKEKIQYLLQLQKWYELSVYHKEPADDRALKGIVDSCCKAGGAGAAYLLDGKLFRCPNQANLHRLGIFPSPPGDYVDLRQENTPALQREIDEFLDVRHVTRIPTLCSHCNGRSYLGREVPPAEQLAPGERIEVRFE